MQWYFGYVSASLRYEAAFENVRLPREFDRSEPVQLISALDAYCRNNPLRQLVTAAEDVRGQLAGRF